jgi:hypothetical protein
MPLGAIAYAFHCADDSLPFIAIRYGAMVFALRLDRCNPCLAASPLVIGPREGVNGTGRILRYV